VETEFRFLLFDSGGYLIGLVAVLSGFVVEHSEARRSRFHGNEWPLLGNG